MEAHPSSTSEVGEVLSKYLELYHQNSIEFKYHLAPNSVIDWYGRTVRGANKIHDYLRHEVHNQFDHVDFVDPEVCAPIETKTSHMRTKVISTKPIDNVHHPINRVPDMVPLKSYADSDVEDNELPMSSRFVGVGFRNTPEKCINALPIEDLTPPASVTKDEATTPSRQSEEEDVNTERESRRRRLKRSHSGRFSYLKRLPTAPSTSKRGRDNDGIRTLLDDTSSEEDELETMEALYTPLRYLEVKGIMRIAASSSGGKQRSALWRDRTQLETRIRISYRRKLEDQQLQFALIIYESVNGSAVATPTTRRNLMSQFTMSAEEPVAPPVEEETGQVLEETIVETLPAITSLPQPTTLFENDEDPLQEETSLEFLSVSQMRTPTKFTHTPPATPKRKPRSLLATTSGLKRLNSTPTAPTPKRSAARSLRL